MDTIIWNPLVTDHWMLRYILYGMHTFIVFMFCCEKSPVNHMVNISVSMLYLLWYTYSFRFCLLCCCCVIVPFLCGLGRDHNFIVSGGSWYVDNIMMTSSKWNNFPRYWPFVWGIHRSQRPVTRSFDVFFDLRLNKELSKQWWGWWFETLSCALWRHCNVST